MSDLQLTVGVVHCIELAFELKAKLDLFFVVFSVLHVFLLEF